MFSIHCMLFFFEFHIFYIQLGSGIFQSLLIGPKSCTISLWDVHVTKIASFDPIPPALGSPHGPNQWFYGAPVVLPLDPAYVTPLTVLLNIWFNHLTSFDTNPAVKWSSIYSNISLLKFYCTYNFIQFWILIFCNYLKWTKKFNMN